MSEFTEGVAPVVEDAVRWAGESARFWLDSYVRLVDAAASGTASADTAVRDMSAYTAAYARDMARMSATWIALGTALLNIDLTEDGGNDNGNGNNGNGDGGGSG
jgi:hypothetical protein